MSALLRGIASGDDRAGVKAMAEKLAALYFSTECLSIRLRDAEATIGIELVPGGRESVTFGVPFEAQVNHRVETPAYGPGRCRKCGKESWSESPLPRAVWPAVAS